MKNMKNTTALTLIALALTLATSAIADVGLTVNNGVKADIGVASVSQDAPSLKLGPAANTNTIFDVSFKGGVSITLPFVSLNVPLGSATAGTKSVGAAAGQVNKVNMGESFVSQALPAVQVGTLANKASLFDVRVKDGLGLTLPFVSLDVPYPTASVGSKQAPAAKK